ncbi:pyridoxamine 5'-phosphate oxidase [Paenimyroides baculatum]|uniref:Pyridoxine/pyridoxamine 5'-phosphate oxidase n=1 Tax=Paenimyroides baculatum TaxID=2608000 RepID=A0A5M6CR55_9FLAO|nr:pyridoxamine 5'-phosphate oxidase [Paenimyroides baculatum]KAA5537788.1 pyridoxamine 5'-phosphate oxidase [Paenimyroides baculatum]
MSDLSNYRKSYEKSELLESMIDKNPMMQFQKWFYETEEFGGVEEVNAMTISTIGLDGFPKSRIVLLKKYDEYGFTFVTNYDSEKGKALLQNSQVCLSFFWPSVERQVIIKGIAEKQTEVYSEGYFHSRPKGSQIGTVVSQQSSIIPNREFLDEKLKILEDKYENIEVPRPENWGGVLVKPVSIEFWQGRANRLHDRIRYTLLESGDWKIERLAP